MTIDPNLKPFNPDEETPDRHLGETVDLSLDGIDDVADLQALADEAAELTPDRPKAVAGKPKKIEEPPDEVMQLLNHELEVELEEAQARILEFEKREGEHVDKHHRLLADFANYRNRTAREIQLAVDLSEKKLLLEVLPVMDNFERCLSSTYKNLEDFHAGVELIRKQFLDALRRIGAEPVELQVGDPFDATHAEALSTTSDPMIADGAIAAVYERGYNLRNLLLRPARVVVNHQATSHGEPSGEAESNA